MPKQLDRIVPSNIYELVINDKENIIKINEQSVKEYFSKLYNSKNIDIFFYNIEKSDLWNKKTRRNGKEINTILEPLYIDEEKYLEAFIDKNFSKIREFFGINEEVTEENKEKYKKKINKINNNFFIFKKDNVYYLLFSFKNYGKMFLGAKFNLPIDVFYNKKYVIDNISFYDEETGKSYLAI